MTTATRRQLADVFERIALLELSLLEWIGEDDNTEPPDPLEILRDITRIRIDLYRIFKEAT